jgi:hypothetical protein
VRFTEFLRTTVIVCAAAASALAAVTVAAVAGGRGSDSVPVFGVAWWVIGGIIGLWLGRRGDTSPPIASLLASARSARTLPEVNPARTLLNRLWPLIVCTLGSAGIGIVVPQVPAIAAGFEIIWALAWRRQASAVTAIEDRDGARFYIERTSPLRPIRLMRTPGFRTDPLRFDGAERSPSGRSAQMSTRARR